MTHKLVFDTTIAVRSPFLFRGLTASAYGVDVAALRDETGRPIIPADQVRGVLRDAMCDLAEVGAGISAPEIAAAFGAPSPKETDADTSNEPSRSLVDVSDFAAIDWARDLPAGPVKEGAFQPFAQAEAGETTRISIDDLTGAVRPGMMQVLELAAPMGAVVRFCGTITVFAAEREAPKWHDLLRKALRLVAGIGAIKSPGYGEVVHGDGRTAIVKPTVLPLRRPAAPKRPDERLDLAVVFDRPLVVDTTMLDRNAALGAAIVPGSVFKGALAERLSRAGLAPDKGGALGDVLSAIVLHHAFPESETPGKPCELPIPYSLGAAKIKDEINDTDEVVYEDYLGADDGTPRLIRGYAPRFVIDWKDDWFDKVDGWLGRAGGKQPPTLTRTHTAIHRDSGSAATQALFTTLARSVIGEDGQPRRWLTAIDVRAARAVDTAHGTRWVDEILDMLLGDGLDSIGKTAARATFAVLPDQTPPPRAPADRVALLLLTPAVLFGPDEVRAGGNADPWRPMIDVYRAYFERAKCHLVDLFAVQTMTGAYLSRRRRAFGAGHYFPFFVTQPGSVFLVEAADRSRLDALLRDGLAPYINGRTPDWITCPYVPQNGFGRVTLYEKWGPRHG